MKNKIELTLSELKNHIPFTAGATLIAIILTALVYSKEPVVSYIFSLFYIMHPAHIIVSAIASSAIFYKYKNNFFTAVLIGVSGSVIIGSLSDIILPYLGGALFQLKTHFHLSLIEKPVLILSAAIVGSIIGITTKFTKIPHLIHVFLSVFASLFYLLAFSIQVNFLYFIAVSFIVFVAVLIPCCISDIIFPLLFVKEDKK